MNKAGILRLVRRAGSLVRDGARAGHLPRKLQGGIRSITASDWSNGNQDVARGVVLGVPRASWREIECAYPEWDLMFANNRVDPDKCVDEIIRLGARAILGPKSRRRQVMALRASGISMLRLSPAPLPRLKRSGRIARGYVIEPSTSWMSARRQSEMEVMMASLGSFHNATMRQDSEALARLLAVPPRMGAPILMIDAINGPTPWTSADRAAIEAMAKSQGASIEKLELPWSDYWDDNLLDQFDDILPRCSDIVSNGHPLTVAALFHGRRPAINERMFLSQFGAFRSMSGGRSRRTPARLAATADLIAVCVLLASRYVCDGVPVDPVEFLSGSTRSAAMAV